MSGASYTLIASRFSRAKNLQCHALHKSGFVSVDEKGLHKYSSSETPRSNGAHVPKSRMEQEQQQLAYQTAGSVTIVCSIAAMMM